MAVSRGKQFEKLIYGQLDKLKNIAIIRLYDTTNGYKNINNPCDFILYAKPKMILLECKAISGHLLNFKGHIRINQWDKLLQYSKISGIEAGILVWFIDKRKTYYIDINTLEMLKNNGKKSFDCDIDIPTIILKGQKKKLFYDYYMEHFIKELLNE